MESKLEERKTLRRCEGGRGEIEGQEGRVRGPIRMRLRRVDIKQVKRETMMKTWKRKRRSRRTRRKGLDV